MADPSIIDLAYRGLAAALGGPVDLATMVMRPFGYSVPDKQVVGGSEWLGRKMEDAGLVSTARAPWQEVAASMVSPGGLAKGAAVGTGKLAALGVTAWHGSPHKFDRFDLGKRGTGEGAQAYGDGAYLAERRGVADSYREALAGNNDPRPFITEIINSLHGRKITINRKVLADEFARYDQTKPFAADDDVLSLANRAANGYEIKSDTWTPDALRALQQLDSMLPEVEQLGYIYKTDIPDEAVARMLNWDKPLSEQAPEVLASIKKSSAKHGAVNGYAPIYSDAAAPYMRGQDYYRDLANTMLDGGTRRGSSDLSGRDALASQHLQSLGIPGIRYLDGVSRGAGEGTSNFVVFDPDMIRVLERNGIETTAKPWLPGEYKMPVVR